MIEVWAGSKEYLKAGPVVATEDGVAVDVTADTVHMAIVAGDAPAAGDWKVAEWETSGGDVYARLLVGPGGDLTLERGWYGMWLKVTDNPEIPGHRVDTVRVT